MANPATKLNSKSTSGCLTDILLVKTASKISAIATPERIDFFELFFMKNKLHSISRLSNDSIELRHFSNSLQVNQFCFQ